MADKYCDTCNGRYSLTNWSRHCRKPEHLLRNKIAQLEAQLEARPQEPEHQTPLSLLQDFLSLQDGPLKTFAAQIKAELPPHSIFSIAKGEVFQSQGSDNVLQSPGLQRSPRTFRASTTWEKKPDWVDCMNDLICRMEKRTQVHTSGEFNGPCTTTEVFRCVKQLETPDMELQYYITNLSSSTVKVRRPDNFDHEFGLCAVTPETPQTTLNLTPKWTRVRPHIDHGKHVLTVLLNGCVKLWKMWPPSDHNLSIYSKCFANQSLWDSEEPNLVGAYYVVTTEDLAIYIPPGWLHETITLHGGGTPGIEFMSAECLQLAARLWDIESSKLAKEPSDNWPFVEAIVSAFHDDKTREEALVVFCERKGKLALDGKQKAKINAQLARLQTICTNCGDIGKNHVLASSKLPGSPKGKRRAQGSSAK